MYPNQNFDTYEKLFNVVCYLLDNTQCIVKLTLPSPDLTIKNDLICSVTKRENYLYLFNENDISDEVILRKDTDKVADDFIIEYVAQQFKVENIKVYYPSNILLNEVKPRIVTAATKYGDTILVGARHYSPAMRSQLKAFDEESEVRMMNRGEVIQGFIDQFDNFYDRKEALKIAIVAGQVNMIRFKTDPMDELFSEDLH